MEDKLGSVHNKLTYPLFLTILTVFLTAVLISDVSLWLHLPLHYNLFGLILAVFASTVFFMSKPRSVYLLDYSCYLPPSNLKVSYDKFVTHSKLIEDFDESSLEFQFKILKRSGLGQETYLPESLHSIPPRPTLAAAREEAEQVIFGALENLFDQTKINPREIGVLVVNCSLFNPTPSLSAMIVNKYKLRESIKSFNLGGMGCSAGVIAVDLANDMLQIYRNTLALVVSTENITLNWYFGNNKAMLLPNCLFRVGGSAVLLSNKRSDRGKSKYRLVHTVRTHKGCDDKAFKCVYQEQDDDLKTGVSLSKDLMAIAGDALKTNITTLGPLVLPIREQVMFVMTFVANRLFNTKKKKKAYIPDFKLAFDHLCIHAGGRAVIDELERSLRLSPGDVEASRMTLHRFGNTSSSSIWYELAYTEAKRRMRKGNKVWQIAFGSGFKCNSVVWVALRDVEPSVNNPWEHCIHRYPVNVDL